MYLTALRPLPVVLAFVVILAWAQPAYAGDETRDPNSAAQTQERIDLYSPRVRHATVMYLRLRLLELRQTGLDRARAAIEHRLSIDDLLAQPPAAHTDTLHPARDTTSPSSQKAKAIRRRTVAP